MGGPEDMSAALQARVPSARLRHQDWLGTLLGEVLCRLPATLPAALAGPSPRSQPGKPFHPRHEGPAPSWGVI